MNIEQIKVIKKEFLEENSFLKSFIVHSGIGFSKTNSSNYAIHLALNEDNKSDALARMVPKSYKGVEIVLIWSSPPIPA